MSITTRGVIELFSPERERERRGQKLKLTSALIVAVVISHCLPPVTDPWPLIGQKITVRAAHWPGAANISPSFDCSGKSEKCSVQTPIARAN